MKNDTYLSCRCAARRSPNAWRFASGQHQTLAAEGNSMCTRTSFICKPLNTVSSNRNIIYLFYLDNIVLNLFCISNVCFLIDATTIKSVNAFVFQSTLVALLSVLMYSSLYDLLVWDTSSLGTFLIIKVGPRPETCLFSAI